MIVSTQQLCGPLSFLIEYDAANSTATKAKSARRLRQLAR